MWKNLLCHEDRQEKKFLSVSDWNCLICRLKEVGRERHNISKIFELHICLKWLLRNSKFTAWNQNHLYFSQCLGFPWAIWNSYLHSHGSCFCGYASSHMKQLRITCCSICLAQLFSLYLCGPITINLWVDHKWKQNHSCSTHGWGSIWCSPLTKWVNWRRELWSV